MTTVGYNLLQLVCWASVAGVAYTYVCYPLLLRFGSRFGDRRKMPRPQSSDQLPMISVIFAAHNEESVMEEKLLGLIASDYLRDRFEVLVGDDASSDATAEIVASIALANPVVRLVRFGDRTGKPAIVNALAAQASGAVLVLTDANIMFDPDALKRIAAWFLEPDVGLVAANIVTRNLAGRGGIASQEDAYIRRELQIKHWQSIMSGVVIAPFGACYAIRTADFRPVPKGYAVDDFYISMQPLILGRLAIQDMDAVCREDASEHLSSEFRRKVRMSRGNFQNLWAFKGVALRPWSALGFHFFSHKVLRWVSPGFILLSYAACAALAVSHPLYRVLFGLMLVGLASPALDDLFRRVGMRVRLLRFASYFLMMNVALGYGFLLWVLGNTGGVWQTNRRA
jgi:cellulose synthase/poly-beta-1,6-N-acetylglucosamine synthase-like glycosyltransferase